MAAWKLCKAKNGFVMCGSAKESRVLVQNEILNLSSQSLTALLLIPSRLDSFNFCRCRIQCILERHCGTQRLSAFGIGNEGAFPLKC